MKKIAQPVKFNQRIPISGIPVSDVSRLITDLRSDPANYGGMGFPSVDSSDVSRFINYAVPALKGLFKDKGCEHTAGAAPTAYCMACVILFARDALLDAAKNAFLDSPRQNRRATSNAADDEHRRGGAARNVSSSIGKIYDLLIACSVEGIAPRCPDRWSAMTNTRSYSRGCTIYREIKIKHLAMGITSAAGASCQSVIEALGDTVAEASRKRDGRHFNESVDQLRKAISTGDLKEFPEELLSLVPHLRFGHAKRDVPMLAEERMIELWPTEFPEDPKRPGRIDRCRGLLGFFNAEIAHGPVNPRGERCDISCRQAPPSLEQRAQMMRLLSALADAKAGVPFEKYLRPERIKEVVVAEIVKKRGTPTCLKTLYDHCFAVGLNYYRYDMSTLAQWKASEIIFPSTALSPKGQEVSENVPLQMLIDFRDTWWLLYKELAPRAFDPDFVPKWPCDDMLLLLGFIDECLREETGHRGGIINELVVVDQPDFTGGVPKIWTTADGYKVAVPVGAQKQQKRGRLRAKQFPDEKPSRVRSDVYDITFKPCVEALNHYIEKYWKNSPGVLAGDRCLILNSTGFPYANAIDFNGYFFPNRIRVAHACEKRTGKKVWDRIGRHAARDVIGEALSLEKDGGELKKWYHEHQLGSGADRSYPVSKERLHRPVLNAMHGRPPLAVQAEMRDAEKEKRIANIESMLSALQKTGVDGDEGQGRMLTALFAEVADLKESLGMQNELLQKILRVYLQGTLGNNDAAVQSNEDLGGYIVDIHSVAATA